MDTYQGYRKGNGGIGTCVVTVGPLNGKRRRLPLHTKIFNHSPTGFEWGYGGSGPAQLALAILADATGDEELAARHHQQYKWDVISRLDTAKPWTIAKEDVLAAVERYKVAVASGEG